MGNRQQKAKANSISYCKVDQGRIPLPNSFKIISRGRVLVGYLVEENELIPNLTSDGGLTQKFQNINAYK